jgi:cell division septation protein DedD
LKKSSKNYSLTGDIEDFMEQKKILWIVIAVSLSLLIIFGFALFLYAPSRSTGQPVQQKAVTTQRDTPQSNIDPDAWVREPGKTPGLETPVSPAPGNINLTIVNGDNAGANYGTLDVSGLTSETPKTQTAGTEGLSTDLTGSGENGISLDIPGQTKVETTVQTTVKTTKQKNTTGTVAVKAPTAKAATAPAAPVKKAAVQAAAAKKITVTDYWIQTGSFSSKLNAEKARDTLTARYLKAEIFTKEVSGATNYRVRVGPYKTKTEADYWLGTVKEISEFSGSYVSEVKTKK